MLHSNCVKDHCIYSLHDYMFHLPIVPSKALKSPPCLVCGLPPACDDCLGVDPLGNQRLWLLEHQAHFIITILPITAEYDHSNFVTFIRVLLRLQESQLPFRVNIFLFCICRWVYLFQRLITYPQQFTGQHYNWCGPIPYLIIPGAPECSDHLKGPQQGACRRLWLHSALTKAL